MLSMRFSSSRGSYGFYLEAIFTIALARNRMKRIKAGPKSVALNAAKVQAVPRYARLPARDLLLQLNTCS